MSIVGIVGKFMHLVSTLEKLAAIRAHYRIPNDIRVALYLVDNINFRRDYNTMIIPLVAFVKGKIRIPLGKLLTNFLKHFNLCPDYFSPNISSLHVNPT